MLAPRTRQMLCAAVYDLGLILAPRALTLGGITFGVVRSHPGGRDHARMTSGNDSRLILVDSREGLQRRRSADHAELTQRTEGNGRHGCPCGGRRCWGHG